MSVLLESPSYEDLARYREINELYFSGKATLDEVDNVYEQVTKAVRKRRHRQMLTADLQWWPKAPQNPRLKLEKIGKELETARKNVQDATSRYFSNPSKATFDELERADGRLARQCDQSLLKLKKLGERISSRL